MIFVPSLIDVNDEEGQQQICRSSSHSSRWEESPGKASLDSFSKSPTSPPSYPRRRLSNKRERLSRMPIRRPAQTFPKSLDDDDEESPSTSADAQRRRSNPTPSTTRRLKKSDAGNTQGPSS